MTTRAPTQYKTTAVNSVVCPGSASPRDMRTRFPESTSAADTRSPTATIHPPKLRRGEPPERRER